MVALAVLPAAAAAHATLEATFPAAQARLANPPDAVRFRFDEGVDLRADSVKVFDGSGRAVQRGGAFHPGSRQAEVAVRLPFELPDGTYTATYHVVSADSHPVSGGVIFHVGRGGAAGASLATLLRGQTAGPVTATAFSVVRAVQFAAIALGLGTLISVLACWIPGLRAVAGGGPRWAGASGVFARRATRLLAVAAVAGVLSALAALALLAAQLQGSSVWSALRPDVLGDLLRTRFGLAWAVGAGLWLVAGAALAVRPSAVPALRPASVGATGLALRRVEPPLRFLLVPLGALAFLPALSGHASVQRPVAVLLPANVAHVAAMAAWLGGIAVLVLALQRAAAELADADGTRLLVAVVARFSRLAGVAIAVILLTGVVQGIVEVGSVPALVAHGVRPCRAAQGRRRSAPSSRSGGATAAASSRRSAARTPDRRTPGTSCGAPWPPSSRSASPCWPSPVHLRATRRRPPPRRRRRRSPLWSPPGAPSTSTRRSSSARRT